VLRDFFPTVVRFLRRLPLVGDALNLPLLKPVCWHTRTGTRVLAHACESGHTWGAAAKGDGGVATVCGQLCRRQAARVRSRASAARVGNMIVQSLSLPFNQASRII
jgi:hypothetical protein